MAGRDGPEAVARPGAVAVRIEPIDAPLGAAMRAFSGPRVAWLPPDEPSVIGCGETTAVEAGGPGRYAAVRRSADALFESMTVDGGAAAPPAATPRLFGGFSFHAEPDPVSPWAGFPAARFVLPRLQVTEWDGRTWVTVTAAGDAGLDGAMESARRRLDAVSTAGAPPPGIADLERRPDRAGWREQVASALDRIDAGAVEKVVLAQTLTARLRGSFRLPETLARLGAAYPSCVRFAVDPGLGAAFFGATPERLVKRAGEAVRTDAIAGSIGRGGTPAEDRRLAETLQSSEKVRREHAVVVEAAREQLARYADDVAVGERSVRKLPNVQHLDTPVSATLTGPTHVLDLVAALHPTPAVGGRPPDVAERFIASTESFDRGWYAAPVGWFDGAGDGTFAVGIRSAVATAERVTLFAGNGIVADSDPDDEWGELQLKYRPILDQLG